MSGSRYILEGDNSELTKHVGHQIEVTGTVSRSGSTGSTSGTTGGTTTGGTTAGGTTAGGTTAGGTTSGSASGSMSSSSGQHLRVSSVRMISSSCSGQ
jgi:hypothetical protein